MTNNFSQMKVSFIHPFHQYKPYSKMTISIHPNVFSPPFDKKISSPLSNLKIIPYLCAQKIVIATAVFGCPN